MSPLPSPEERRKQLRILGLEPSKRTNVAPLPSNKSAATEERAQQRKEGQRRSRQVTRP